MKTMALLIATVTLIAGPAVAQHDPACDAAWEQSGASKTCITHEYIRKEGANSCRIMARCLPSSNPNANVNSVFSLDDVKKLNNCGSKLKVGSC